DRRHTCTAARVANDVSCSFPQSEVCATLALELPSAAAVAVVKLWPGSPYPLGATYDGSGTNFSVFSEVATRVELCLFDEAGNQTCADFPETTAFLWHGYAPNISPGQRYGFRVHGPWEPQAGHRCNPSKLLLDPYGKAVAGHGEGNEALLRPHLDNPNRGSVPSPLPPPPSTRRAHA